MANIVFFWSEAHIVFPKISMTGRCLQLQKKATSTYIWEIKSLSTEKELQRKQYLPYINLTTDKIPLVHFSVFILYIVGHWYKLCLWNLLSGKEDKGLATSISWTWNTRRSQEWICRVYTVYEALLIKPYTSQQQLDIEYPRWKPLKLS